MANITVQKNGNVPAPVASVERDWEPFRVLRDLMNWDPFRELAPYPSRAPAGFVASFDIKETKEGYEFKADVPGVKESDLEVTVTGNRLTVSGKRHEEKREQTETYFTYERSYGAFSRSFTMPSGADLSSVHADLKDGVLTISVRRTPETQPKKIDISSASKKS